MMSRMELVEFLLARIAEDEAAANAATPGSWRSHQLWANVPDGHPDDRIVNWSIGCRPMRMVDDAGDPAGFRLEASTWDEAVGNGTVIDTDIDPGGNFDHIARHDPARVLAECEAKRWIVELHGYHFDDADVKRCDQDSFEWPCATLMALAAPCADHPDYDEAWRP